MIDRQTCPYCGKQTAVAYSRPLQAYVCYDCRKAIGGI